jgi:hypothetical protein
MIETRPRFSGKARALAAPEMPSPILVTGGVLLIPGKRFPAASENPYRRPKGTRPLAASEPCSLGKSELVAGVDPIVPVADGLFGQVINANAG